MGAGDRTSADDIRATLWFWPSLWAALSVVVTLALLPIRSEADRGWASWMWVGDASTAGTVLEVIATSVMAATTLTFSLTVVALQIASQQYSPRLLRDFARDRKTQGALAFLVSTFVIALVTIRGLQEGRGLPVVAIALSLVMGLLSAGVLLAFVGHIVRVLRVDNMMLVAHQEASSVMLETWPPYDARHNDAPQDLLPPNGGGTLVPAPRSGFVRVIRDPPLVEAAREGSFFIRLRVRAGDHVIAGTPVAAVWSLDGDATIDTARVQAAIRKSVEVGFERTVEQDAALGFRQLTDIAVKALSPAINDPITAGHAIGYCADLLCRLLGRNLAPQARSDGQGTVRLVVASRDLRYFLDLVCSPIRRFGSGEPIVLTALLRMLRDCAVAARDDAQRGELRRQADRILASMDAGLIDEDASAVRDLHRRFGLALQGDVDGAYSDRAGETRSI